MLYPASFVLAVNLHALLSFIDDALFVVSLYVTLYVSFPALSLTCTACDPVGVTIAKFLSIFSLSVLSLAFEPAFLFRFSATDW